MTNQQSSGSQEASVAGQNRPSGDRTPTGGSPRPSEAPTGPRTGPGAVPTQEQLLHLVDRAERGVLTPPEARLLRHGVLRLLTAVQPSSALSVPCPVCGAEPAQRCRAVQGTVPPRLPHRARVLAGEQR